MQKKEMTIGQWYATKYGRSPVVLLSFGGYIQKPYSLHGTGIFVMHSFNGSSSDNLMLRLDTEDAELQGIAASYTEADYLAGKPVPKGASLICATSREITMTWEDHESMVTAAKVRDVAAARAKDYRRNVTVPQVVSEMRRLGMDHYVGEYSTDVKLSFAEFLELAARIPTGES